MELAFRIDDFGQYERGDPSSNVEECGILDVDVRETVFLLNGSSYEKTMQLA